MGDVSDFNQAKIDKEKPSLGEIINSLTSNNCDKNRPHLGQQPKRGQMEIKGLSRRDICDCMVLGILECKPDRDTGAENVEPLPRVYISKKDNEFKSFKDLDESGEAYKGSHLDPERITYNDLYGWDLDKIDPVAAVQNMACHLERRLGIFPALVDFE